MYVFVIGIRSLLGIDDCAWKKKFCCCCFCNKTPNNDKHLLDQKLLSNNKGSQHISICNCRFRQHILRKFILENVAFTSDQFIDDGYINVKNLLCCHNQWKFLPGHKF